MDKHTIKFISEQKKYLQALPDITKNSITLYTYDIYKIVNEFLETGEMNLRPNITRDNIVNIIKDLDEAIENAPPTTGEITVYRGVNLPDIQSKRYSKPSPLIGYTGKYKGFTSTTLDKYVTPTFAGVYCCTFIITIPKGFKVLYIGGLTETYEDEVLLPRNSIVSITSIKDGVIYATVSR